MADLRQVNNSPELTIKLFESVISLESAETYSKSLFDSHFNRYYTP